jgi:hypothetical protein
MNEEAKKFLQSKGYVPDENGKYIVSGDDGHEFDLAELLDEYVSAKNTTPPVPPPAPKP